MANQPGPASEQGGSRGGDTAKLRLKRARRRRPLLAMLFALIAVCGLLAAGYEINGQLKPRKFTPSQQRRIEAWEVAKRWRTTPKTEMFPAVIGYQLTGGLLGHTGGLSLKARRLIIAPQTTCAKGAGATPAVLAVLDRDGCQAVLRATYADATSTLVLTVGVEVLKDAASAKAAARYLTHRAPTETGAVATQLVLHPVQVAGTPAAVFGAGQRQLSWVVGAGSYLVVTTVGYADGRPHESVSGDSYTYLEMTSLARGVAQTIAGPLAAPAPVPRCPGALTAC